MVPQRPPAWKPQTHRGIVVACEGVVSASQPLAVSAGIEVLKDGGSCIDAAIAISATLTVIEPYNSHIGGDAFAIVWDGRERRPTAYNGSGRSPAALDADAYAGGIPPRGLRAATVPGLVDCWFALHGRFGRLPFDRLLAPAIGYAERGFPAGFGYSRVFAAHEAEAPPWFQRVREVLTGLRQAPQPGTRIVQPDLAWTLSQIAAGGRDAFYEGPITERLLDCSRSCDGFFGSEDFAQHRTIVADPLTTSYRDLAVHAQPPVSQGVILIEMLNIVEGYDLSGWGFGSPQSLHVMVEAKKAAFADRLAWLGDPDRLDPPVWRMTDKAHAAERRRAISLREVSPSARDRELGRDTTYFCVADAAGNAVSFIQSVYKSFGCGVVAPGTGVLVNNRMTGFSLDPASPNVLAPAKRPIHTLNAYIVTERDRLRYVGGTPGGDVQVQSNLQVISSLADHRMNVQEAVEAPRWQHVPGRRAGEMVVQIEDRFGSSVTEAVRSFGHAVEVLPPWGHSSSYQLIGVDPDTGAYFAASDPRCDGHAAGY